MRHSNALKACESTMSMSHGNAHAAVEPSAFSRISTLGVEEQRVHVILDLDAPREQWRTLGDGYRVEAQIEIWRGEAVLSLPTSAVFRHEDRWAAFVVDDGRARLVALEPGWNLCSFNCEHAARWVLTGRRESRQLPLWGGVAAAVLVAFGLLARR